MMSIENQIKKLFCQSSEDTINKILKNIESLDSSSDKEIISKNIELALKPRNLFLDEMMFLGRQIPPLNECPLYELPVLNVLAKKLGEEGTFSKLIQIIIQASSTNIHKTLSLLNNIYSSDIGVSVDELLEKWIQLNLSNQLMYDSSQIIDAIIHIIKDIEPESRDKLETNWQENFEKIIWISRLKSMVENLDGPEKVTIDSNILIDLCHSANQRALKNIFSNFIKDKTNALIDKYSCDTTEHEKNDQVQGLIKVTYLCTSILMELDEIRASGFYNEKIIYKVAAYNVENWQTENAEEGFSIFKQNLVTATRFLKNLPSVNEDQKEKWLDFLFSKSSASTQLSSKFSRDAFISEVYQKLFSDFKISQDKDKQTDDFWSDPYKVFNDSEKKVSDFYQCLNAWQDKLTEKGDKNTLLQNILFYTLDEYMVNTVINNYLIRPSDVFSFGLELANLSNKDKEKALVQLEHQLYKQYKNCGDNFFYQVRLPQKWVQKFQKRLVSEINNMDDLCFAAINLSDVEFSRYLFEEKKDLTDILDSLESIKKFVLLPEISDMNIVNVLNCISKEKRLEHQLIAPELFQYQLASRENDLTDPEKLLFQLYSEKTHPSRLEISKVRNAFFQPSKEQLNQAGISAPAILLSGITISAFSYFLGYSQRDSVMLGIFQSMITLIQSKISTASQMKIPSCP